MSNSAYRWAVLKIVQDKTLKADILIDVMVSYTIHWYCE